MHNVSAVCFVAEAILLLILLLQPAQFMIAFGAVIIPSAATLLVPSAATSCKKCIEAAAGCT
jgi:hypothetical protein